MDVGCCCRQERHRNSGWQEPSKGFGFADAVRRRQQSMRGLRMELRGHHLAGCHVADRQGSETYRGIRHETRELCGPKGRRFALWQDPSDSFPCHHLSRRPALVVSSPFPSSALREAHLR